MVGIMMMPNDSPKKTLFVALMLSLVCSVLVAGAAVLLKPIQEANKQANVKVNILSVAGLLEVGAKVDELFRRIDARVVDLNTGEYATDIDPATYDMRKASQDPALSTPVPAEKDIASIKRRPQYATVYLVKDGERLKLIILPIKGYGLWSTLYGFLALEPDLKTVHGINFYEHAETPGLGAEVQNPKWVSQWQGKVIYDEHGVPVIDIVKGTVDKQDPESIYKVESISGATLTSQGVENMLRYWLGPEGFGPYIQKLQAQQKG